MVIWCTLYFHTHLLWIFQCKSIKCQCTILAKKLFFKIEYPGKKFWSEIHADLLISTAWRSLYQSKFSCGQNLTCFLYHLVHGFCSPLFLVTSFLPLFGILFLFSVPVDFLECRICWVAGLTFPKILFILASSKRVQWLESSARGFNIYHNPKFLIYWAFTKILTKENHINPGWRVPHNGVTPG